MGTNEELKKIYKKKFSCLLLKLISPYVIIFGVSFVGFKFSNLGYPIFIDKVKKYNNIKTEYIEDEIIYTDNSYKLKEDCLQKDYAIIEYYDSWQLQESGIYTRNRMIYEINEKNIDKIKKAFFSNDYQELLIEPTGIGNEESKTIYDDQKSNHYVLIINEKKSDEYIVDIENKNKNNRITILYFLITIFLSYIFGLKKIEDNVYDYQEELKEIEAEYALKKSK